MTGAACLSCGSEPVEPFRHGGDQRARCAVWRCRWMPSSRKTVIQADGRFWRTLRRLARDPARAGRDTIEGRRAGEIPPPRVFLAALLLLFGVGSLTRGRSGMRLDAAQHRELDGAVNEVRLLPVGRPTLWLLRLPQRRDPPFDHLIASLHSLCFAGLVPATATAAVLVLVRAAPEPELDAQG